MVSYPKSIWRLVDWADISTFENVTSIELISFVSSLACLEWITPWQQTGQQNEQNQ